MVVYHTNVIALGASRGNVFSAHVKYTHDKARRAMFSMYKYWYYLGQQPPGIFRQLFDSLIKPILQYGVEIWANSVGYKPLETMYLGFLKKLLRVRNQTPNLAVYVGFGSVPIKEENNIKTLKYYGRLEQMLENILVKRMHVYLKHMNALGHATWFSNVQVVVSEIERNNSDNIDLLQLKNPHIHTIIRQKFEENWQENIENVQINPKLRTYKLFKKVHEFEPYLHITNSKLRSVIVNFRTIANSLEIKRGRYAKPKTSVEK